MATSKTSTPKAAPRSSTPQAAPQSSAELVHFDRSIEAMANDPEFKKMNPNVKLIDGKLEHVAPEPYKRPPLVDLGGKRREKAITEATHQMEAIFEALIAFALMEYDETPLPGCAGSSCGNTYVTRALAIRGHDLSEALMAARQGDVDTERLEGLVYHGSPIDDYIGDNSIRSAKSKSARSKRKVAAAA